MRKILKKSVAIIGIVAVMISSACMVVSANDIVDDSTNILWVKDFYNMSTFNAWGYTNQVTNEAQKEAIAGNSFSAFINKNNYGDRWDSRDRWSLYYGSGQYINIDMVHNGVWNSRNGLPFYSVATSFGDQTLFDNGVTITYDSFLYDTNFINIQNQYYAQLGNRYFYDQALIPYMLFEDTSTEPIGDKHILVHYSWTEYILVKEESGKEYLKANHQERIAQAYYTGYGWIVPMLPIEKQNGYLTIGSYTEENPEWYSKNAIYLTNLKIAIGPQSTVDFNEINTFYCSAWQIETYGKYTVTYDDFINQYPSNEPEIYNLGTWLLDTVGSFLSFEIYPGLNLLVILSTIVAIPLLIAFLKVFAGG